MSGYERYWVCSCGWWTAPSFGNLFFLPDVCPSCGASTPRHSVYPTDGSKVVVARKVRVRDGWFRSHLELQQRPAKEVAE